MERAGAAPQAPPHPRTASAVSNAAAAQGDTTGCPLFGRPLKGSARRRRCQKQLVRASIKFKPPALQLPALDNLQYCTVLGGPAAAKRGQLCRRRKGCLRPRPDLVRIFEIEGTGYAPEAGLSYMRSITCSAFSFAEAMLAFQSCGWASPPAHAMCLRVISACVSRPALPGPQNEWHMDKVRPASNSEKWGF